MLDAYRPRLISLIAMPVCDVYTFATQPSSLPPPLQCMTQPCAHNCLWTYIVNQIRALKSFPWFSVQPPKPALPASVNRWFAVVIWTRCSWICSRLLSALKALPPGVHHKPFLKHPGTKPGLKTEPPSGLGWKNSESTLFYRGAIWGKGSAYYVADTALQIKVRSRNKIRIPRLAI